MAQLTGKWCNDSKGFGSSDMDLLPASCDQIMDALSDRDRMLVLLRDRLYEGRWEEMLSDLRNQIECKPFIFRLKMCRVKDIDRIRRLGEIEAQHRVAFAAYMQGDGRQ